VDLGQGNAEIRSEIPRRVYAVILARTRKSQPQQEQAKRCRHGSRTTMKVIEENGLTIGVEAKQIWAGGAAIHPVAVPRCRLQESSDTTVEKLALDPIDVSYFRSPPLLCESFHLILFSDSRTSERNPYSSTPDRCLSEKNTMEPEFEELECTREWNPNTTHGSLFDILIAGDLLRHSCPRK
jgi:hypothetical protein